MSKAIRTVGPENIQRKPLRLVKTRYLSLSRRGFRALEAQLSAIRRIDPTGALTYRLRVKLPDGTIKEIRPFANLLPTDRELRILKRDGRVAMIEAKIKTEVFTDPDVPKTPPSREGAKTRGPMSPEQARKILNKFKRKKGVTFSVTIDREFPPKSKPARSKRKKGVARRIRHRR